MLRLHAARLATCRTEPSSANQGSGIDRSSTEHLNRPPCYTRAVNAPSTQSAVVVLTRESGELLLVQRSGHPPYPDAWVFPGGKADLTDTDLRHTAARELLEEVGVQVSPDALEFLWEIDSATESRRYTIHFFSAGIPPDIALRLDERELTDHRWVTPAAALLDAELLAAVPPATRTTLSRLKNRT